MSLNVNPTSYTEANPDIPLSCVFKAYQSPFKVLPHELTRARDAQLVIAQVYEHT